MRIVIARHEAISELCVSGKHSGDCFVPRNDKRLLMFICVLCFILFNSNSFAQSTYDNNVYQPYIKSVEFYNTAKQPSFPAITLNSSDKVLLAFDDLRGGTQDYNYTIEHCDANWNSSSLSTTEYLQNYTDDKITDYNYSTTTVQKYTHYQLKLPNENIAPKIPGNYVLKVYEDSDPSKLILTRKLYVVSPKITITAEIVPSNDASTRQTNQKVNFTINYGNLRVQNPGADLRTFIMQNARNETMQLNTEPANIRGSQLIFNDVNTNDFPGGNEFRHFDTRTLKLNSERILSISRDTSNKVVLLTDPDRDQPNYSSQYDLNGNFYILNQDGTDPRTDADYTRLLFSLNTKRLPSAGTPYIIGQFNDYKIDDHSKLNFDEVNGKYFINLFLKQGVYDYEYVWVDKATGKPDDTALEGSHFETENDYQVLVYYHPSGARWDELVGYQLLNTVKK
ncbi:MAG: hypothetical protein JWQ63_1787 [Mucilaginibacter sp.]|nr:hypothetical protein [Mucilaginibacter sp.]